MSDWSDRAAAAMEDGSATVTVVGCGYVGLTLAVELARTGCRVTGIETNEARAKELRAGVNPVPDVAITDTDLVGLREADALTFVTELTEPTDAYVICVNTPLRDGSPDLRFVEAAGESVAKVLGAGQLVVLESTTYPGTTEELLRPILEEATGLHAGTDFALAHSPERINPADTTWTLRNTPKIVGGFDDESTKLAAALYERVCSTVVRVSSPRAAEITKLYENTYREVNIALANEMAIVCQDFDIDPWEVLSAATTKPYGFTPFRPGPGVGGECIPVDPQYLAWRVRSKTGRQFRLLETASDINRRMPGHVAQRTAEILNAHGKAVRGARVLLLGVAYKGGSGDMRESPAIRVADRLVTAGADITYHDPFVGSATIAGVLYESQPLDDGALDRADIVVILTDHPDLDYRWIVDRAASTYDTRGVTEGITAASDGRLYRF